MKTIQLVLAALAVTTFTAATCFAQEPVEEMTTIYEGMDAQLNAEQLKAKSDQIALLEDKYPDSWMAKYYQAWVIINMTYVDEKLEMSVKDAYLDVAKEKIEKMALTCPLKDEVFVMKAMLANARLVVDGQNRWKEYGAIFDENLKLAKEVNEANPHIYYLKAVSTYYTPKMFGGGPKNALPYFEKAKEKYAALTTRTVDVPYWGEGANTYFIGLCTKK